MGAAMTTKMRASWDPKATVDRVAVAAPISHVYMFPRLRRLGSGKEEIGLSCDASVTSRHNGAEVVRYGSGHGVDSDCLLPGHTGPAPRPIGCHLAAGAS